MATTTTKKKSTTKTTQKYVGVNYEGGIYVSDGPVQLCDNEYCIWLSKKANVWTTDYDDAKYNVRHVADVENLGEEPFVCEYETFEKLYPHIDIGGRKTSKTKAPSKQIPFCV